MKQSCGLCVRVYYQGKSIDVTAQDTCPVCASLGRIDLVEGAWTSLESNTGLGLIPITWEFCSSANARESGTTTSTPSDNGLSGSVIAGIVVGSILAVALIIGLAVFVYRRPDPSESV